MSGAQRWIVRISAALPCFIIQIIVRIDDSNAGTGDDISGDNVQSLLKFTDHCRVVYVWGTDWYTHQCLHVVHTFMNPSFVKVSQKVLQWFS